MTSNSEAVALLKDLDNGQMLNMRQRVLALASSVHLQISEEAELYPGAMLAAARSRILAYFCAYPKMIIKEEEIMVVAGVNSYNRRIRELCTDYGWHILSGTTLQQMNNDCALDLPNEVANQINEMRPHDYIMIMESQDREATYRWWVAKDLRKKKALSAHDRILEYLKANVGHLVSGEEISYVAKIHDWPRRCRELRTEEGWPVQTKNTGRPDLPVGMYVLESLKQAPPHDRHISDATRVEVLNRDHHACRKCSWKYTDTYAGDPRKLLELHHLNHHATGGTNDADNLITLCNVDHDILHANKMDKTTTLTWIASKS